MTHAEVRLHEKLLGLWARKKATRAQILRCMELDRKAGQNPRPA